MRSTLFKRLSSATLIAMIVCSPIVLLAQSPKIVFEKYGVEEGLPEEVATNFIQDRQGFIWIGTQNGLVKFDGYTMKVYRSNTEDPNALHLKSSFGGLLLAQDGKIWMAGYGNTLLLSSYDPETGKFTNFPIDFGDITDVRLTGLLMEDVAKQIWFTGFSSMNNLLTHFKLDPPTGHVTEYPFEVRGRPLNSIVLNGQFAESKTDSSLWLNTTDGNLHRYDRKKDAFELKFEAGNILPGTALSDSIQAIFPAGKSGLIPMGNNQNIHLWDPLAEQVVESYHFPHREAIPWIGAAFEDEYENLWVSSGGELTQINRKTNTKEDFIFGQGRLTFASAPDDITRLVPFYQNQDFILFGVYSSNNTRLTFLRFKFRTEVFDFFDEQFNDKNNNPITPTTLVNIPRFLVDHSGLLWMGARPNLYKQSPKSRQIERIEHDSNDTFSLPSGSVTTLFEDSRQRLWIGLSGGIALKVGPEKFQEISWFEGNQTGSSLGAIRDIIEDSRGQIWAGSVNGLFRWSESRSAFQKIQLGFSETISVQAIAEDQQGRIWISITDKGVYILNAVSARIIQRFEPDNSTRHLLKSTTITGIFEDANEQIWLWDSNTNNHGLFRFIEKEGRFADYSNTPGDISSIKTNRISFITEDDRGKIWVGTANAGLYLYEPDTDLFIQQNDRVFIPSSPGFTTASNGKMWFTSYSGQGLALVGPDINDIQLFGEEQGLLHNDATGAGKLAIDDFGRLWLPTMRGISVFDTLSHTFTNYGKEDGYLNYSRRTSAYRTSDGDIWIGSGDGLYRAVPADLIKKDTIPPKVWITAMGIMDSVYTAQDGVIFEKAVSFTQRIELQHWQKDIRFEFVALHYLRSKDNQYSWKLENYDKDWTKPSTTREAAYTNLSPGTYTFRVKASNADGVWNEEGASITIVILPPWWQTLWAYLVYIVMFLTALRSFSLWRERRLRAEKEQLQVKVDERTSELKKKSEELTHSLEDLKSTQGQLIQQEKLASLGQLTAGIAHEIKNPLNFVNNFSNVSLEMIDEAKEELSKAEDPALALDVALVLDILSDIKLNLTKIHEHGSRADGIVKSMLQHSRGGTGKMEPTDLNALVSEFVNLSYHGMRAGNNPIDAEITLDLDSSIGEIPLVYEDFSRVILNICTNAFDALRGSGIGDQNIGSVGHPRPEGRGTGGGTAHLQVRTRRDSNRVVIEIEDNGPGIPDDIKDKILQPFFTTKKGTQGTGLGLSITHDIIKAHGGELAIQSKPGKTTFSLTLPC